MSVGTVGVGMRRGVERIPRTGTAGQLAVVALLALGVAVFLILAARRNHFFDLRVYYGALNHWAHGGEIYDYLKPVTPYGFTYPPFAALTMLPMTLIPLGAAQVVSVLLAVVTTGLTLWWLLGPIDPSGGLVRLVRPRGGRGAGRGVGAGAGDGHLRAGQHRAALPRRRRSAAARRAGEPVGRGRHRRRHRDQTHPWDLHRVPARRRGGGGRPPPRPARRRRPPCSPPRVAPDATREFWFWALLEHRPGRVCSRSSPISRCAAWSPGSASRSWATCCGR